MKEKLLKRGGQEGGHTQVPSAISWVNIIAAGLFISALFIPRLLGMDIDITSQHIDIISFIYFISFLIAHESAHWAQTGFEKLNIKELFTKQGISIQNSKGLPGILASSALTIISLILLAFLPQYSIYIIPAIIINFIYALSIRDWQDLIKKGPRMQLEDGANIVVIGGGPAGSFFAINLLRKAKKINKKMTVTIIEKKKEINLGAPKNSSAHREGCNFCAGALSPKMCEILDNLGIVLPDDVIQGRVSQITVDMEWKMLSFLVPLGRKIISVFRGARPEARELKDANFDSFMLEEAIREGAEVITGEVQDIKYSETGKPLIICKGAEKDVEADFVVFAGGVNLIPGQQTKDNKIFGAFKKILPGFRPPSIRKALIFELKAGNEFRGEKDEIHYILYGSNDLKLEFVSIIPKGDFITIVLIGPTIDSSVPRDNPGIIKKFLALSHIKQLLPNAELKSVCICNPSIVTGSTENPLGDRIALVGDAVISRLYKDGIWTAYVTASALADTILNIGIDNSSLKKGYGKTIRQLKIDNWFGHIIFMLNKFMFSHSILSRIIYQAVLTERKSKTKGARRLEDIFWKIISGDDMYRNIFISMFHPIAIWSLVIGGALVTIRNILTESIFGLSWRDIGRYPVGIYKEEIAVKRKEFIDKLGGNLSTELQRNLDVERIYSIKIRADKQRVVEELGKFGEEDREYFRPKWIKVKRTERGRNELGSVIRYNILNILFYDIVLESFVDGRFLVYRIRDSFAKGGVLIFDINGNGKKDCILSVYVAFSFDRGNLLKKIFWFIFKPAFPAFMHDVIWNHSLCQIKDVIEKGSIDQVSTRLIVNTAL